MLLLKARRKKIAEGQTVIYNIRGRALKYKKVSGVMKYVGVADKAEPKKKVVKKEPKLAVRTTKQKDILGKTGIDCKDDNAVKYVENQMSIFTDTADDEIDYSKLPAYVQWIYMPTGSIQKYTPNKIGLNMSKMIEHDKIYGANIFDGVPKAVKDIIAPFKKRMELKHKDYMKVKEIERQRKALVRQQNKFVNELNKVASPMRTKYFDKVKDKFLKEHNLTDIPFDDKNLLDKYNKTVQGSIPTIIDFYSPKQKGADRIETWGDAKINIEMLKRDKSLTAAEKKTLTDVLKKKVPIDQKIVDFDRKNIGLMRLANWTEEDKKMAYKLKKNITKDSKDNPGHLNWYKAIYNAFYINKMLLPKVKKNPKLVKAKESLGVENTNQMRKVFIQKRGEAYKTETARKKMLSALSDSGQENMTFSLKTVTGQEMNVIKRKMEQTFDSAEHGTFGFKIHGAYQIGDAQYYDDYKKLEKALGSVKFSYHGTSFARAAKIARGGFKIKQRDSGRMLGNGLYGSDKSSKSLQYIGGHWTRQIGTRGVLFVCKNALGSVRVLEASECREDICDKLMGKKGGDGDYDTVMAYRGTGGLRNNEWCCRDPKQYMPIYWIDAELANPGVYE